MKFEYFAPNGEVLTVEGNSDAPWRFLGADGLGPVPVTMKSVRSPGQRGTTAVDLLVPARVVTLQFFGEYVADEDYWQKRSALSRALVVEPPLNENEELALGVLRVLRVGHPDRETTALARDPAMRILPRTRVIAADVEFYCPSPYWQETEDTLITLESAGGGAEFPEAGFELPEAGFEIAGNDVEQEVVNEGDVSTPIVARLYGEATTVRIRNITTGEDLEVTGDISADEYVEVNTGFGTKKIELVTISTGARTSIMDRLNLAKADFWVLRPGSNVVRFEADVNVSGRAVLVWRQLYGGI